MLCLKSLSTIISFGICVLVFGVILEVSVLVKSKKLSVECCRRLTFNSHHLAFIAKRERQNKQFSTVEGHVISITHYLM